MGPLTGYRIIELAGIGAGPFGAMLLSDMGAEVIRIDRVAEVDLGLPEPRASRILHRGRRSLAVDLKHPDGVETVLGLVDKADGLLESFRPGVTERLGLGPVPCLARNPMLVYGRMTGWGQNGPCAQTAGHDINYIALSGALHAVGPATHPTPPLNLVGDFGGGGVYLALGMVAGLLEAHTSRQGQVVDASMVDGAASLMAAAYGMFASGSATNTREDNVLDGGAFYYGVYQCRDGRFVAIGAIEHRFYVLLLALLGFTEGDFPDRTDRARWPEYRAKMAARIATKSRDEWVALMAGADSCCAPVLDYREAPRHPHNVARHTFVEVEGVVQPAPAPRFSRTPSEIQKPPSDPGQDTEGILIDWGFTRAEIVKLRATGAVR